MNRMQAHAIIAFVDFIGDHCEALVPHFETRMRLVDLLHVLKVELKENLRKGEYEDLPNIDMLRALRQRATGRENDGLSPKD